MYESLSALIIFLFLCLLPIIYITTFSFIKSKSNKNFGNEFISSSPTPNRYTLRDMRNLAFSNKYPSSTCSKIKIIWLIQIIFLISGIIFLILNLTHLINTKNIGLVPIIILSINPISNKLIEKILEKESVSK